MQLVDSSIEDRAAAASEAMSGGSATPEPSGRSEGGFPVWRVACGDMINRDRSIAVYVDGAEVVVVGPPGESARLTGSQLDEFRTALDEAAKRAER